MLKKILTLLCLAAFIGSFAACGGDTGASSQPNEKAKDNKPLTGENTEEAAATEAF